MLKQKQFQLPKIKGIPLPNATHSETLNEDDSQQVNAALSKHALVKTFMTDLLKIKIIYSLVLIILFTLSYDWQ